MNPEVTIVVISYNRCKYLKTTIENILENTEYENYKIIIVDNNSTYDNTKNYLKQLKHPKIECIFLDKNYGGGVAINTGFNKTNSQYLCSNDGDIIVPKGWLKTFIKAHKQFKKENWSGWLAPKFGNYNEYKEILPPPYIKKSMPVTNCIMFLDKNDFKKAGQLQDRRMYGSCDGSYWWQMHKKQMEPSELQNVHVYHIGINENIDYPKYLKWKQKILGEFGTGKYYPVKKGFYDK